MNHPCAGATAIEYSHEKGVEVRAGEPIARALAATLARIGACPAALPVRLLAVSKAKPATAIRSAFTAGQQAFGENYLQEALAKQTELADLAIEWHYIGALQSRKCEAVARHFDWVQTVDRAKLVSMLAAARPRGTTPLQVLVQVNIDAEAGKAGCTPDALEDLAGRIAAEPALCLRGLMAIPFPAPDLQQRRSSFRAMRALFDALRSQHPGIDTLSMGMSEDFELAIAEGATMVRLGSTLFGARGS